MRTKLPLAPPWLALAASCVLAPALAAPAEAGRRRPTHEAAGSLTWMSPHANPIAISPTGDVVLVANTTSGTVDAIDTGTGTVTGTVAVGVDPVSIAFRPDGLEAWVANHVSDSVSVIDTDASSASHLQVIESIQSFDADGVTLFDEPVGIAFASNTKAYVALSSRNEVAVVDATTYEVTAHLAIAAQEPRAIAVRNGRLYVAAFESGNQSELSMCGLTGNAPDCTLFASDLPVFADDPNLPGLTKNIVIDANVPDRDLFVFDTATDALLEAVEGVGTLLYGVAVDGTDRVYVTQTDARNHENGIVEPAPHPDRDDLNADGDVDLADLGNRMFVNEVAILDCSGVASPYCAPVATIDLDPTFPDPAAALATPFGIALSADETTIVATAAGTSRVFTMTSAGAVQGQVDVGRIPGGTPRGVALRSDPGTGAPLTAYVLNVFDNSVAIVDVSDPSNPSVVAHVAVGDDPTRDSARFGRFYFNNALASTSGNFSCASCHPDGNTDQLLWRIGGACIISDPPGRVCVPGEDEPRATQAVRGLRDTLPLHWDGSLGDPFGGSTGATGSGDSAAANCDGSDSDCFRQLVDASLAGVMCEQPCVGGGELTDVQRSFMTDFLSRAFHPPARSRRIDDSVSPSALAGFEDFFMDQGGSGSASTCADSDAGCHELPLLASSGSESAEGFDAPTMRGLTDRFLQFSNGITSSQEFLAFAAGTLPPGEAAIEWDPAVGFREVTTFAAAFELLEARYGVRPLDIFQMIEEASTGVSGATGRQVTLNTRTTGPALLAGTEALLLALEAADAVGSVNLRGHGLRDGLPVEVSRLASGQFLVGSLLESHASLIAEAQAGMLLVTLTARLRSAASTERPLPLAAPPGAACDAGSGATGDPALPVGQVFDLETKHLKANLTVVFIDGAPLDGATTTLLGGAPACPDAITTDLMEVDLGAALTPGTHLLQLQARNTGFFSNEIPLQVP